MRRFDPFGKLLFVVSAGALAYALFLMLGCSAGRLEGSGDVVVGLRVGSIPETVGQFANAAASFLPPPFNGIVTGLVGIVGAATAAGVGHKLAKSAADQRDAHFDEGVARASGNIAPAAPPQPVIAAVPAGAGPIGPAVPAADPSMPNA